MNKKSLLKEIKEPKESQVQIKLTKWEKQRLQRRAKENGMSMTQYVRSKCIYD